MLKSKRDKSKFIVRYLGALMISVQQISGQACVIVFSDPHLFRFSGFTKIILHCCSLRWLKGEKSPEFSERSSCHVGLNQRTIGDGTTGTSWCVASARLCGTGVSWSLPLWSGKLPTIMGCHRRRCRRYHHYQQQYCCLWHQFLVLFSEAFHS